MVLIEQVLDRSDLLFLDQISTQVPWALVLTLIYGYASISVAWGLTARASFHIQRQVYNRTRCYNNTSYYYYLLLIALLHLLLLLPLLMITLVLLLLLLYYY